MSEWYYVENAERIGPVDHHALVSKLGHGELSGSTLVWKDGMADWATADSIAELSAPAAGIASHGAGNLPAALASVEADPFAAGRMRQGTNEGGFDPFSQEEHGLIQVTYAGFWKRFVAYIIDSMILQAFSFALQIVSALFLALPGISDNEIVTLVFTLAIVALSIAAFLGYFALFESGAWQATPGKKVLGIKVTGLNGERITLGRAVGRNLGKMLSGLVLMIGYIMAGFTEKKQALHDMLAGCLVINA